jgi:sugar lactone lactonase YvrE
MRAHLVLTSVFALIATVPVAASAQSPAPSGAAPSSPVRIVWSTTGGPDGFSFPNDMALDPEGRLWVADTSNGRFVILEPDGTFVETWGTKGEGDGEFNFQRARGGDGYGGIAFAPDGSFYVLDVGNRRVQRFSLEREFLRSWGGFGSEPGQYMDPVGIEVTSDGTVYVLDDVRDVVERYDPDGNEIGSIDAHPNGPGGFNTANLMTVDTSGNVYVNSCCAEGNFVQKLGPDGDLIWTVDSVDGQPFADQPSGVAVDAEGRVFVSVPPEVLVFDSSGVLLGRWGSPGTDDGQFVMPYALLLDGDGAIYVADHLGNRVQKFELLPPLGPS